MELIQLGQAHDYPAYPACRQLNTRDVHPPAGKLPGIHSEIAPRVSQIAEYLAAIRYVSRRMVQVHYLFPGG